MREWIKQWLIRLLDLDEYKRGIRREVDASVATGVHEGIIAAQPSWPYGDVATAEQVAALNTLSDDDRADTARKKIEAYAEEFATSYLPDMVERLVNEALEHRPITIIVDPESGATRIRLITASDLDLDGGRARER